MLAILLLVVTPTATPPRYRCTDADGAVTYTRMLCPSEQKCLAWRNATWSEALCDEQRKAYASTRYGVGGVVSRQITSTELGDRWPLVPQAGVISCQPYVSDRQIVTFSANGQTWALNGTAAERGYSRIEPVWRPSPDSPSDKVTIEPLVEEAQHLCEI